MGSDEVSESGLDLRDDERACPVFGVESGGPLIGLGVLLILFAILPFFIARMPVPIPAVLLFTGFGIVLIWAGVTK
jgi:hypothetical protein